MDSYIYFFLEKKKILYRSPKGSLGWSRKSEKINDIQKLFQVRFFLKKKKNPKHFWTDYPKSWEKSRNFRYRLSEDLFKKRARFLRRGGGQIEPPTPYGVNKILCYLSKLLGLDVCVCFSNTAHNQSLDLVPCKTIYES